MNAIISKGDKTAHVQLPVGRKQLSGALSYLGANHTSDYDLRYNEENKDGLKVSLECFGVVEIAYHQCGALYIIKLQERKMHGSAVMIYSSGGADEMHAKA